MTSQPATPTTLSVADTYDRAPEALKSLVAAVGVAASTTASHLAGELEEIAAQLLALAEKVRAGASLRAERPHPDAVSGLALRITEYQARLEAWTAVAEALSTA